MSDKAFIDTNVFIYSLDSVDLKKRTIARQLLANLATERTGTISFQVVQEFFSVAYKRFPSVMRPEDGLAFLMSVFRPLYTVHSSLDLYRSALSVYERYRLSWYDSLILAAAAEAKCSVIYTEDLQHGAKIEGVRIENPFRNETKL